MKDVEEIANSNAEQCFLWMDGSDADCHKDIIRRQFLQTVIESRKGMFTEEQVIEFLDSIKKLDLVGGSIHRRTSKQLLDIYLTERKGR